MKKLFVIAAFFCVGLSACYKIPKPAQAYDVLTRHKWKIQAHVNADVDTGADCRVPSEVEFNKDSTGYFYYTTPCSTGDNPKKTFRWYISVDNRNIYYSYIEGAAGTFLSVGISSYSDAAARFRSADLYKGHFWDGDFISFGDKP